ncbi:MAG: NADH-quinone oxidoreductase subunit H [Sedimentisphaerales bacterium]|nr:NADH-quinone oxidoreductase subunit H [Sedimentisphaerales bacterium]
MNSLGQSIIELLLLGFLLTAVVGLVASWIVRKVSAKVQYRVGPPFMQPFYDVIKLLGKEQTIPEEANGFVFCLAPLVALSSVILLSTMLLRIALQKEGYFAGDVIVVLYLLAMPSLALILGASASASPHASIGSAREMKLLISYELPLLLAFTIVLIKASGQIEQSQLLSLAALSGLKPIMSISGCLAFLVSILCIQAKLGLVPFDVAEAETELAGGVIIEYSGPLLAMWTLEHAMLLVALPVFVVELFLGGFDSIILGIIKYVVVVVLLILIKNTNPRMRIDQIMKFFWYYCSPILIIALVLAVVGNFLGIGWL